MNDVTNRFGFSENAVHGRVPGPFVPLQDEPHEVTGVRAKKTTKTVLVPQIQSMKEYILKHCKRIIFRALNQSIQSGCLDLPFDPDGSALTLSAANCSIGDMSFWRYDKYNALADIVVLPEICTADGLASCPLYVELWINMKAGMEFCAGECGHLRDLPERPYWRLSNYLIPILRKDEIEAGAEDLLLRLCPNALSDLREHNAYVLAERMGLNVERLPLYNRQHTLSMLFFCEGTVVVQEDASSPDDEPPAPYSVSIPGNTILINTRAVHKDYCQLEIYHECIHYDWHFMFYRLQHMHNNDINALKTKRIVITDSSQNKNPLTWMEWQANRGSFGLMMPLSMMSAQLSEKMNSLSRPNDHWGKCFDLIARRIAEEKDLPKFRVRARLIQMNYIAAKGALNYVDGSYIEPFAFDLSKGSGKSDTDTVNAINAAIECAMKEGIGKFGGKIPPKGALKLPLRDGDTERDDDAYAGCYFVNANSKTAPQIVDKYVRPILDRSEVYSGVYAHVSLSFYAFNTNGNKGIACGLGNIQKVRDGEPLGGRTNASSEFETLDDEDFLS